jgi:hypothetical protein
MAAQSIRAFHECVTYTTQTFDQRRGFSFLRFITGVFVVTLVAGVAAGGVMLSPLSNAARGLTFHSSVVDRGSLITLAPDSTASVTLRFRNSGLTAWERGSDAQVDLGVKNDSVEFAKAGMAVGWLTENRIATTAESVVPPGAVGSFTFDVRAPTKLGIYRIPVRLVVDDVTWLEDEDTFISVASDFGFHGELIDQTEHPTLHAGETRAVTVRLGNTGTRTWTRGSPGQQVNLGLEGDDKTLKGLGVGWPSADRVAIQTEPVVAPGAIGSFTFRIRAPSIPGTYPLRLRPVVDGVTWMEASTLSLINVVPVSGAALSESMTSTATADPTFRMSAAVDSVSAIPGHAVAITASVTSDSTTKAFVGVEVLPPVGGVIAYGRWYERESFQAGEVRTFNVTWQIPPSALPGPYTVRLRAFGLGWKPLFGVNDAAATISVADAPAPPMPPSPAPSAPATAAPSSPTASVMPSATPASPTAAPSAAPSFTSSANVAPASVDVEAVVTIDASFSSATATNALVTVSVYPPGGAIAVHQESFDNQSFAPGQLRGYPVTWLVPAGATAGTYRVSLGVFSPGWATQYSWKDDAANFAVKAPAPTPSPMPTPVAQTQTPAPIASTTPVTTATPTSAPTAPPTPSPTPTELATPTPQPPAYSLQISSSASGSAPSPLAGKTVSGGIYVFMLPESGVTQVRFFLAGILVMTQSGAPFALAGDGGGLAFPFDTRTLTNGSHTLSAQVDHSGGTAAVSAVFTVANQAATPTPAPTPSAAPTATPSAPVAGCPSPAYTRLINVSTPTALRDAVNTALPGDRIVMAPGIYSMTSAIIITRDGTQANPIQLVGPRTAILDFGSVSAFRFLQLGDYDSQSTPGADWWILRGFTHRNAQFGIALWNSNHNVLCELLLENHGQQALALKGPLGSSDNIVRENEIRNTGRSNYQYGEGIYIGAGSLTAGGGNAWSPSHRNWIYRNRIGPGVTAEHVDIKPTTRDNLVEENVSDATGYRFKESSTTIIGVYRTTQVDSAEFRNNIITNLSNLDGTGGNKGAFYNYQGNNIRYHGNRITGVDFQYGFRMDGGSGNVIGCDNVSIGHTVALANVTCR